MSAAKKKPSEMKPINELTEQQLLFIDAIIKMGFRRRGQAYMTAYPNCKESSADAAASRLLKKVNIKEKLEEVYNSQLADAKKHLEREIFDYWYVRMTYDPTEIIDLDGNLVMSVEELRKRGLHVVIDQINQKMSKSGPYVEYKLADRDRAADRLQEYIQMIKPVDQRVALTGKDGESLAVSFNFIKPSDGNTAK